MDFLKKVNKKQDSRCRRTVVTPRIKVKCPSKKKRGNSPPLNTPEGGPQKTAHWGASRLAGNFSTGVLSKFPGMLLGSQDPASALQSRAKEGEFGTESQ